MPVILEKGNTDVGLRAGEFIQKNRQMALQQAIAAQEAQRDIARMAIQREQALQQQRFQMDQALREDARAAADLQYRYDALRQNKTLAEMESDSRSRESAASREHALRMAELGESRADSRADQERKFRSSESAASREQALLLAEKGEDRADSRAATAESNAERRYNEARDKEERVQAQKVMDANTKARQDAALLGLDIPEGASTEGIMRLVGVTQSNREQIAIAEKKYNDLQNRLVDVTTRAGENPSADARNIIQQLQAESNAALAHVNNLKQIVRTGGAEQSPQRTPLPVPQAPLGTAQTRARDQGDAERAYWNTANLGLADKASVLAAASWNPLAGAAALYQAYDPDRASARKNIAEKNTMKSLTAGSGGTRQTPKGLAPSIESLQRMEAIRLMNQPTSWWLPRYDVDYTSGTGR